jgi:hypothetical protein
LRGAVAELPLVKTAMEMMGAQIVQIDEDFAVTGAAPQSEELESAGLREEE